jgi:hypothetical protein
MKGERRDEMLVPGVDSQRRDFQKTIARPAREKAGGHYAAGLLLQLPAREVRFRCDSMPKV